MIQADLIKGICQKEIQHDLYATTINGIPVYIFLRRNIRMRILKKNGIESMKIRMKVNKKAVVRAAVESAWHLFKLFCKRRRYSTVFYAFPRVDKIHGIYLDKFTDAIIEQCGLEDYMILDHGRAGIHPKPRLHSDKIVYMDLVHILSELYAKVACNGFAQRHKEEFNQLSESIEKAFGIAIDNHSIAFTFLKASMYIKGIQHILRHVSAKRIIGPARHNSIHIAAHQLGLKVFELQHGITYGETLLYSGYRDPQVVPDKFLTYGENNPKDVYGIDEKNMVNIGWALWDYIDNLPQEVKFEEKDVLVVSDPIVTDAMLGVIKNIAPLFPDITFHFRPHPQEILSTQHKAIINSLSNVKLQDNHINITEVLRGVKYVVGEKSTVLYEALSEGKRVGHLFFEGLHPVYLKEKDRELFWEIRDKSSFDNFINSNVEKSTYSIYSPFNKEKFLELLKY